MAPVAINEAFHRLVKDGNTAEQAWKRLKAALMSGELKLWCNGNPVALDYVNAEVRFIIRNGDFLAWPGGGGIGWNPLKYSFTINGERFERLLASALVGRPSKEVTASNVEQEIARRRKAGQPASQNALAKHFGISRRTVGRLRKEIIVPK